MSVFNALVLSSISFTFYYYTLHNTLHLKFCRRWQYLFKICVSLPFDMITIPYSIMLFDHMTLFSQQNVVKVTFSTSNQNLSEPLAHLAIHFCPLYH